MVFRILFPNEKQREEKKKRSFETASNLRATCSWLKCLCLKRSQGHSAWANPRCENGMCQRSQKYLWHSMAMSAWKDGSKSFLKEDHPQTPSTTNCLAWAVILCHPTTADSLFMVSVATAQQPVIQWCPFVCPSFILTTSWDGHPLHIRFWLKTPHHPAEKVAVPPNKVL